LSERILVDWTLAERIALAFAGDGHPSRDFGQAPVAEACSEARGRVLSYTGLVPRGELPPGESVNRATWARTGLRTLRELGTEVERRLTPGLSIPGPLGGVARSVMGAAAGTEAGFAVGYAARRVLGQYDFALLGPEREPRLLFVAPNIASAHEKLGEPPELFLRWIAIHETTHAVQFASVPWLRDHLAGLLEKLIEAGASQADLDWLRDAAGRLLRSDPRETVRRILRGDLPRMLAGPAQAPLLDRIQATMALIEGYAEHVMDAVVVDLDPGYARLRGRFDALRASRGGVGAVIARLLGLELKLRQYTVGKAFCDAVAAEAGVKGLNAAWSEPEALPTLAELDRPGAWIERLGVARPAAA
jgi:coenzyme F420 biosynthesis associated uncharacterized protein